MGRRIEIDPGYSRSLGDKTYAFAAILEFRDRKGLLEYLRHPMHHELGRLFWETCEDTVICEVESVDGRDPHAIGFLSS